MPIWEELLDAIHDKQPVSGLTHSFYKYPARFSPAFARQMILAFSKPGELVFDPFMGGGTTLVEACALGRSAIGTDINSLSVFLAETKTSMFTRAEIGHLRSWAYDLIPKLNLRRRSVHAREWAELGYQRNISGRSTWPIRKTLELALRSVQQLESKREQKFARCALLRTAQWALDCREDIPSASEIRKRFLFFVTEMIDGARQFTTTVRKNGMNPKIVCLHRSAIGIEAERAIKEYGAPALILTSPPYPGVHVLYHRWQVLGRRETPAPFWIAGTLDGAGGSFYTFGDRKQDRLLKYYGQARLAFTSVAKMASSETIIVQMVAFSEPRWQLRSYLKVMEDCGLTEVKHPQLTNHTDGRVWRSVPNRRWYADKGGATGGSKEVVLFHKRA
ncbi:MAG: site-specific DNA-methyltransferase [Acidobacteriales bacterium]|nr:site-specific DNA-methyltransferase [Terriglobales bacterium]